MAMIQSLGDVRLRTTLLKRSRDREDRSARVLAKASRVSAIRAPGGDLKALVRLGANTSSPAVVRFSAFRRCGGPGRAG